MIFLFSTYFEELSNFCPKKVILLSNISLFYSLVAPNYFWKNFYWIKLSVRRARHFRVILLNGGVSFRWSFGPHFAWGSIESTTILTTHPSLRPSFFTLARLRVVTVARPRFLTDSTSIRCFFEQEPRISGRDRPNRDQWTKVSPWNRNDQCY